MYHHNWKSMNFILNQISATLLYTNFEVIKNRFDSNTLLIKSKIKDVFDILLASYISYCHFLNLIWATFYILSLWCSFEKKNDRFSHIKQLNFSGTSLRDVNQYFVPLIEQSNTSIKKQGLKLWQLLINSVQSVSWIIILRRWNIDTFHEDANKLGILVGLRTEPSGPPTRMFKNLLAICILLLLHNGITTCTIYFLKISHRRCFTRKNQLFLLLMESPSFVQSTKSQ